MEGYSDNYPYNIESPQKLYIQYSHDIDWDYSTGQYPDGTEDDWHWESKYIPISHSINGLEVGRHEWMRVKVGTLNTWTYPIRISANVTNISAISSEIIDEGDTYTEFSIILHFEDGSTVESESIRIRNGEDGLGIALCEIREDGYLYITYTDGTIVNAGRAREQDAEGLPSMADDDYLLSQSVGVAVWISPLQAINNALLVTLPIEYDFLTGTISHNLDNGNKHIPIGGSSGFILSTDGSGNYTWIDPTELDPTVPSWVKAITETQILNWDTAYSWGDHTGLYADLVHTHLEVDITDLDKYTQSEIDLLLTDYMNNYVTQTSIDWNTYSPGRAEFISSNTNGPLGSTVVHGLFIPHSAGATNTYGTVIAGRLDTDPDPDEPTLWFRNLEASVWTNWIEILHTSNIDAYLATFSHNSLDDVGLATTGITYGHIDDQAQTIYGVKTFNSFPVTPNSAPTTDYQVTNKKYVDDSIVAVGNEFDDNVFRIRNNLDTTSKVAFDLSGITTSTTRTLTIQDLDGTVALVSDIPSTTDDLSEGTTNLYSQWSNGSGVIYYNSGNVGIGASIPSSLLEIYGNEPGYIFVANNVYSTGSGGMYLSIGSTNAADIITRFAANSGSNNVFTLYANGYIDIQGVYDETDASAANVFVASDGSLRRSTSSKKIKKDINYNGIDPNLALQFKPVSFTSKQDGKYHLGFIAEDLEKLDERLILKGNLPGLQINAILASISSTIIEKDKEIKELYNKIDILENKIIEIYKYLEKFK